VDHRDERTGKRRKTTYRLTRTDAARQFPGAEPDLLTRQVRDLPELGESTPANFRRGH